jgi:8-oxo-dGTP diphosphatase
MSELKQIEVVAAVIVEDDKLLATQRGYGDFKGKWEFPGGKIEQGETHKEALVREIKEELNADIEVLMFLTKVEHDYEKFHLTMHTYICSLKDKIEMVKHGDNEFEHDNMVWLDEKHLDDVDWLPADIKVINAYKKLVLK